MSICKSLLIACVALIVASTAVAEGPGLGQPLSDADIAALDVVVLPDGDGLPPGEGDARQGAQVYERQCLSCHGERGVEGVSDRLAGGHGTIDGDRPVKTVGSYWPEATTLFDYIRRAMPYQTPGSLSADEVYALTAYILYLNDIVAFEESLDADSLPAVNMPNADNFVWAYEP